MIRRMDDESINEVIKLLQNPDIPFDDIEKLTGVKRYTIRDINNGTHWRRPMPNLKPTYIYVLDIDGKFSNKTVTAYVLKTGQQRRLKVKARTLEADPIEKGDILRIDEEREEGRWSKDEQGQWIQSKTDKETILRKYVHVR